MAGGPTPGFGFGGFGGGEGNPDTGALNFVDLVGLFGSLIGPLPSGTVALSPGQVSQLTSTIRNLLSAHGLSLNADGSATVVSQAAASALGQHVGYRIPPSYVQSTIIPTLESNPAWGTAQPPQPPQPPKATGPGPQAGSSPLPAVKTVPTHLSAQQIAKENAAFNEFNIALQWGINPVTGLPIPQGQVGQGDPRDLIRQLVRQLPSPYNDEINACLNLSSLQSTQCINAILERVVVTTVRRIIIEILSWLAKEVGPEPVDPPLPVNARFGQPCEPCIEGVKEDAIEEAALSEVR